MRQGVGEGETEREAAKRREDVKIREVEMLKE